MITLLKRQMKISISLKYIVPDLQINNRNRGCGWQFLEKLQVCIVHWDLSDWVLSTRLWSAIRLRGPSSTEEVTRNEENRGTLSGRANQRHNWVRRGSCTGSARGHKRCCSGQSNRGSAALADKQLLGSARGRSDQSGHERAIQDVHFQGWVQTPS